MSWQVVAQGNSIESLEQIKNISLPVGSKVRAKIESPVAWLFDMAGAELAFRPFTPDGLELIDVYAEGGAGYVDYDVIGSGVSSISGGGISAIGVVLTGILAFIRAHWVAITIAGFLLTSIVASIIILVKLAVAPVDMVVPLAIIGGFVIAGIFVSKQKEN